MADVDNEPDDAAEANADALALAEAEAEAAEAEALAAAARARARAIRLRRKAEASEADADSTQTVPAAAAATTEVITPPTGQRRPGRRVSTALAVAVVVVICGLLTASGYMLWHRHTVVQQQQRTAVFVAAAKQGVINMLSLDFKKAKEDVQRVLDNSTGEFRDDFQKRADDFTSVVQQSKVVTEGAVGTAAVESMGKDSAVVLVQATERVTNAAGAKDEPRSFRLRVSVARDGDQIKLSKVEFVL